MLNIGIVSQARLGSSRLPAKVLMDAGGKTLLEWHFERLAKSGHTLILATTDRQTDDPLSEWAKQNDVPCFRGSEQNVLSRYRNCARQFNLDVIVRVTSDCPLIDGDLIASGIAQYLDWGEQRQYLSNGQRRTYPRGFDFEIFSSQILEEAYHNALDPYEFEHVTPYFYRKRRPDIAVRHFEQAEDLSHLRVTVDTAEDFELLRQLIEDFSAGDKSHREITDILISHPELVAINHHIEQKKVV